MHDAGDSKVIPFGEVTVGQHFLWAGEWWTKEVAPSEGFTTTHVATQRHPNSNRLVGLPDIEMVTIIIVHIN